MAKAATLSRPPATTSRGSPIEALIVGVLLLAVALVGAVVFLVAAGLVESERIIADADLRATLLGFADSGPATQRAITAAASALVGLGSLVVLFRRAGGDKGGSIPGALHAQHILLDDDDGRVMVSTDGIASVAETAAVRAHGVVAADVRVSGQGSAPVRIHLIAYAYRGADLRRAGREARENVKASVEKLVGIDVTDVNVEIVVTEEVGREVA